MAAFSVATKQLFQARWIAPMDQPPIENGGVVFAGGMIVEVGDAAGLRAAHPDAAVVDLGDATVLPGLINAHVHLELSALPRMDRPASFAQWLQDVLRRMPVDAKAAESLVLKSVEIGAAECVKFGVTAVGDISRQCAISRLRLSGGPLRVVSYGEVQAMAQRRDLIAPRIAAAIDAACASNFLKIGLSPHAPYSVEPRGYRLCLEAAITHHLPLATHLAETPEEANFLSDHGGPLRGLWDFLRAWDDRVPKFSGGPIRFAKELGYLDAPAAVPMLLAHVNCADDEELAFLAAGNSSVVYCPRTHEYFGRPPHRWREMLGHGINVAVGTDSRASAPDLNLVDDLRLLRKISPEISSHALWEMATTRAARAIGLHGSAGSISPGKAADFAIFPIGGSDPLTTILQEKVEPSYVFISGEEIARS